MSAAEQFQTIALRGDWETVFDPPAHEELERGGLADFLPRQRWFAGKSLRLARTRLADWGAISEGLFLVLVDALFADETKQRYFMPLAVQKTDSTGPAPEEAIVLLQSGETQAWLIDGLRDERLGAAIVRQIAEEGKIPLAIGRALSERTSAFGGLGGEEAVTMAARSGPSSSSNSFLLLGEGLVLKIFRQLQGGINPDLEVGRFLTERTDFTALPRVAGSLGYHHGNEDEDTTLAIAQQRVASGGDAWSLALVDAQRFFDGAGAEPLPERARGRRSPLALAREAAEPAIAALTGNSLETGWSLGRVTAEMHLALASRHDEPRFAPEPLGGVDAQIIAEDVRREAGRAFAALENHRDRPDLRDLQSVAWLLAEGTTRVDDLIAERMRLLPRAMKMRIHGDYHLGQVLRTDEGFVILDFEGEPARQMTDRRRKFSPARDLAGMLRSYHYAAFTVALGLAQGNNAELARLLGPAETWQRHQGAAFLRGYLERAGAAPFIPADDHELEILLESLTLAKALYELAYELNNRPAWAAIPICGLVSLLGGPAEIITASDS